MIKNLLLIDFENIQKVDLSLIDETFQVMIFVGASQKSVPIDLVTEAQKLGTRAEWRRVDAQGSNALDFFIACELGRAIERSSKLHCIILSKDKGFDPLLRHLNKSGLSCKRINSLLELGPNKSADSESANYKRTVEVLQKSEKRSRPRKRKTLSQHISSIFQKKLPQAEIDGIIDVLFAHKLISETNGTITYAF